MFDLNMEDSTSNNITGERVKQRKLLNDENSGTNTELSGTSSASSIVNAEESPISGTGEYDFFVSKPKEDEPAPFFVTHQLFPVGDHEDSKNANGGSVAATEQREFDAFRLGSLQGSNNHPALNTSSSNNQWLNLSVTGSGSGPGPGVGPSQVGPDSKPQVRRSRRGPRSRSSQYRGVTFYRRTGRWESHIWDCGKQVYLGGFDTAHAAARAYDRAAIKFRGVDADINFNITDYDDDLKQQMKNLSKEEFVHILRRQSTGFARGSSRYRGVTLPKCGRWEARMGQLLGKKADLQNNGREAVTNFPPNTYGSQLAMQTKTEGDGHNLDLNLGISIALDGPKPSNSMGVVGESQTHSSLQFANGKRPMNGTSNYYPTGALPLYGQPLGSRQTSTMWSGFPPSRPATYEEKVSDQKLEAMASARLSNWPWYMQNQGQGGNAGVTANLNQVQLLSTAASSGFPFSTATGSSTTLYANPISNHTHLFPPTSSTCNSFQAPYGQGRSS